MNTECAYELLEKRAFVDQLRAAKDFEEVRQLFAGNGVEFSAEDESFIRGELEKAVSENENEEFSAEELDAVSGGAVVTTAILIAAAKVAGVSLGSFLAAYAVTKSISKALHSFGC